MTNFCGSCGKEITPAEVFDGEEVVCSYCHSNFWMSEALPADWKAQGLKLINEVIGGKVWPPDNARDMCIALVDSQLERLGRK